MYSHLRYSTQIFLISRFKPWFFCRVFCGGFYFSFLFVFISGFFFGGGYLHMYSHLYLYASFCLLDWQHVVRSSMLVVVLLQTKQVLISVDYSIYLYTHILKIYLIL